MKDRKPLTVIGGEQEDNTARRWVLALNEPWDHIQPNTDVVAGQMTVFDGDRRRLHRSSCSITQHQLERRVSGVSPAQ